ncbi:hypothetical protein PVK06_001719 [Gossypium arboreum]|uniref:Uncharacterized protein n=1 Tax=Gossypium arboreum TaxID=29729 RepID=A0ABR0R334_GOSAR|nr:hypothetical protein PVK06_001719 [Gossypium arboreum]
MVSSIELNSKLKRAETVSSNELKHPLVIEDLITIRYVFMHYLVGHSPNGYKQDDSSEVAKVLGATSKRQSWPYVLYGIVHNSGNDSKETTSTLREINEAMEIFKAMDLRATLRAQHKKRKTDTRALNVIVNNEEKTDTSKMEFCHKKRENRARTSAIMKTTLASSLASSPTVAHKSSPITTHDNPPFPYISPPRLPLTKELPIEDSGKLAPSHQNFNSRDLRGIVEKWRASVLEVDFDALTEVEMYQFGFDVRCLSRAAWDEFASKWRNSMDFYLEESPC